MTDPSAAREPVTLDEQIAAVKRALALPRSPLTTSRDFAQEDADLWLGVCLRRAIETLQQHKRAMTVVEAARAIAKDGYVPVPQEWWALSDALAAFDTAEPSESSK